MHPGNIGFTNRGQLKLFDFGNATLVKKRMFRLKTYKMTNIGTYQVVVVIVVVAVVVVVIIIIVVAVVVVEAVVVLVVVIVVVAI